MVVPKFTAIAKKIRPTTRQQTTTVMNKNTRGRGRKRKKQGKDEDDEEEEEGKETVSESESSPRGKAKGADGEEEEEEQQQQQRGGGEEKKTPRKEDEGGMTTLAANAEQTKDAIDIQLKPNMDPRLKGEIENAFETVTKLIHRMDAHNAQTLEHLDMVRKATEERNRAAKDKLLDIMTESFRKLADKANESAMLEEKIEAMKDMIANLRQSIGA
ncbi:unnamed protein product [Bathycoccus prasinos]